MKIHLAWIRMTAVAAIVAGVSAPPAIAQYPPYRPIPAKPATPPTATQPAPTAPVMAPQPQYTAFRQAPAAQYPQYPQTPVAAYPQAPVAAYQPAPQAYQPAPAQRPMAVAPYQPAPVAPVRPAVPYPQTAAHYPTTYGAYPYVAQQPTEALPVPDQAGAAAANAAAGNGQVMQSAPGAQVMPTPAEAYANGAYGAAGCGCNGTAPAAYNPGCYQDYGVSSYCDDSCGHDNQCFGGIYFLFMERDDVSDVRMTVEVDHAVAPDPYYPPKRTTVVSTTDTDYDFREGVEIRFGSTFTIGDSCESCDSCNTGCNGGCNTCQPCTPPPSVYAWEVAWWGLDDDAQVFTFADMPTTRIYGMKSFHGLEYDRDAGATWAYRPVNDYYDYGLPIPDPGPAPYPDGYVSVLAQRVRTNFKAQNLELNIIRFPVCDICMGGGCNSGCGGGYAAGCGYDACSCDTGAAACGCEEECCPSVFSMYGSCGVRYFRIDDDFMFATEFTEWEAGAPDKAGYDGFNYDESNELYYDIQVENNLVGPQLGWTMNYCIGCKWNLFCNSTFGVFNNHAEQYQRMFSGGDGTVRFVNGGETFVVNSDKNDISFLGELRLGGSYDVTCNWRAIAAYRAVAITGIANSTDQIADDFSSYGTVAHIDSDNGMIVHGVQVGAECRY